MLLTQSKILRHFSPRPLQSSRSLRLSRPSLRLCWSSLDLCSACNQARNASSISTWGSRRTLSSRRNMTFLSVSTMRTVWYCARATEESTSVEIGEKKTSWNWWKPVGNGGEKMKFLFHTVISRKKDVLLRFDRVEVVTGDALTLDGRCGQARAAYFGVILGSFLLSHFLKLWTSCQESSNFNSSSTSAVVVLTGYLTGRSRAGQPAVLKSPPLETSSLERNISYCRQVTWHGNIAF